MDEFIKDMWKTREWGMPNYRPKLQGYKGLGELRWASGKKEHRLIGYLRSDTFFAMMGCTHRGKIYDPTDALDEAAKRKSRVERNEARTVPYDL